MRKTPTKLQINLLSRIIANDHAIKIKNAFMSPAYEHLIDLVVNGYLNLEKTIASDDSTIYLFEISDIVIDCVSDVRCYMNFKRG